MFARSSGRPRGRSVLATLLLVLVGTALPAVAGDASPSLCKRPMFFAAVNDTALMPALCPIDTGSALVDATYFQNASAVGGTALAAFPLTSRGRSSGRSIHRYACSPASPVQRSLFDARDAHAFDAMVVSLDRGGFRYVMTDDHTDKPVWQRRYMGQAHLTATTIVDLQTTSRSWAPGSPRSIAVGDVVKVYGFGRGRSTDSTVYRLEDRGGR